MNISEKKHKAWNKGQDCRVDLICPECGSNFKRYPSQIRKTNFCSKICKGKTITGVKRPGVGKKISKAKKLMGLVYSKETRKKISNSLKGRVSPMSGKVHSEEVKQTISLANTKHKVEEFSGYITSQNKLDRNRFKKEIQKTVFERDNYTCQMCGDRGCSLQVDHIKPWAEYIEGRFDINNCRTLCMDCHYKITYGREKPKSVKTWGHNLSQTGGLGS